jgi:hypothetical protein
MSSPGLGLSGAPQPAMANAGEQKLRAERVVKAGASWFVTVGVLSIINSVLAMSGTGFHFIFGLGVTELVDVLAHQIGQTGFALDLVINGFVTGVFVLFWHFARKGQRWAFLVGMALYALDALLMLYFRDILSVAFHLYALYRMYSGLSGILVLQQSESAMTTAGAPIQPQ